MYAGNVSQVGFVPLESHDERYVFYNVHFMVRWHESFDLTASDFPVC